MKYYDPDTIRSAIRAILSDEWRPNEYELPGWSKEDALLLMCSTMTDTVYSAGMREVQQGIIKALDLRHLLGVDAR